MDPPAKRSEVETDLPSTGDESEVSAPRALSLEEFQFNFGVSDGARARALMGPPAFALRAKRCDEALQRFWSRIDRQHDRLWLAAGDGRIDEDGHELRPALLDDEGRDPLAARSHSRELFRDRKDPKVDQREAFNRAWHAYLDRCGLGAVARIVRDYNKYFPMEAELKTDPKTESYLWLGLPWEPKDVPSRDDILERFPLK